MYYSHKVYMDLSLFWKRCGCCWCFFFLIVHIVAWPPSSLTFFFKMSAFVYFCKYSCVSHHHHQQHHHNIAHIHVTNLYMFRAKFILFDGDGMWATQGESSHLNLKDIIWVNRIWQGQILQSNQIQNTRSPRSNTRTTPTTRIYIYYLCQCSGVYQNNQH